MTLWTVACQAPLSTEFSRHEYWSGLPYPSPGDFPNLGSESGSPHCRPGSLLSEPPGITDANKIGRIQMIIVNGHSYNEIDFFT